MSDFNVSGWEITFFFLNERISKNFQFFFSFPFVFCQNDWHIIIFLTWRKTLPICMENLSFYIFLLWIKCHLQSNLKLYICENRSLIIVLIIIIVYPTILARSVPTDLTSLLTGAKFTHYISTKCIFILKSTLLVTKMIKLLYCNRIIECNYSILLMI